MVSWILQFTVAAAATAASVAGRVGISVSAVDRSRRSCCGELVTSKVGVGKAWAAARGPAARGMQGVASAGRRASRGWVGHWRRVLLIDGLSL